MTQIVSSGFSGFPLLFLAKVGFVICASFSYVHMILKLGLTLSLYQPIQLHYLNTRTPPVVEPWNSSGVRYKSEGFLWG